MRQTKSFLENRKYRRLKVVFPIDFSIVRLQGNLPGLDWHKGFTSNVSGGGLCLETSGIAETSLRYIQANNVFLDLRIHVPFHREPLKASGEISWYEKEAAADLVKFYIGIKFYSIPNEHLKSIMRFAHGANYLTVFVIVVSLLIFGGLLMGLLWKNFGLLFGS